MAVAPITPTEVVNALTAAGCKPINLGAIAAVVGETACMIVQPVSGPHAGSPIWFTMSASGSSSTEALAIANKFRDAGFICVRYVPGGAGATCELMTLLKAVGGGYYTTAGFVGELEQFKALCTFLFQREA